MRFITDKISRTLIWYIYLENWWKYHKRNKNLKTNIFLILFIIFYIGDWVVNVFFFTILRLQYTKIQIKPNQSRVQRKQSKRTTHMFTCSLSYHTPRLLLPIRPIPPKNKWGDLVLALYWNLQSSTNIRAHNEIWAFDRSTSGFYSVGSFAYK